MYRQQNGRQHPHPAGGGGSNLSRTNSFTHGYGPNGQSMDSGSRPLHHHNPRVLVHRPFSFTQGVPPTNGAAPNAAAAQMSIPEMSVLDLGTYLPQTT